MPTPMPRLRVLALAAAVLPLLAAASSVAAQVEPEAITEAGDGPAVPAARGGRPISLGLLLGGGVALGEDANPWGFGFGVRGGYNLGPWFFGGRFVYHVGSSIDVTTSGLSTAEVSYSLWELSGEAGYDVVLAPKLVLRPSVGLGLLSVISSADLPLFAGSLESEGTNTHLLLAFGASALYDITDMWFAGLDLRFPIGLGGDSVVGLTFYGNGGVRF
jgi:hypothetical protein